MSLRQTIELEQDQKAWVVAEAKRRGCTVRELFRQLVDEARRDRALTEGLGGKPAEAAKKKPPRDRFLAQVRKVYDPALAADAAEVAYGQVKEWLKEAGFREVYEEARHFYRAGVQRDLVELGRNGKNVLGLLGFLNANDGDYGQPRLKAIQRILDPVLADFVNILEEELGPQAEAVLGRVMDRFDAAKADRLAALD